jgi:hypothetical protein
MFTSLFAFSRKNHYAKREEFPNVALLRWESLGGFQPQLQATAFRR